MNRCACGREVEMGSAFTGERDRSLVIVQFRNPCACGSQFRTVGADEWSRILKEWRSVQ